MTVHPLQLPAPEPSSVEWLARDEAVLAGVLPRVTDVVAVRGEGSWLYDAEGRRYLDFGRRLGQVVDGTHPPTPGVSICARCRRPE